MNCASRVRMAGNFDEPPLSDAIVVARQLAEINRIRRASFKAYPGMEHVAVKILLHIFLGQDLYGWTDVSTIPQAVGLRASTVARYVQYLDDAGLAETEKAALGQIIQARLTGEASAVMTRYLNAIAQLLSPDHEDHR